MYLFQFLREICNSAVREWGYNPSSCQGVAGVTDLPWDMAHTTVRNRSMKGKKPFLLKLRFGVGEQNWEEKCRLAQGNRPWLQNAEMCVFHQGKNVFPSTVQLLLWYCQESVEQKLEAGLREGTPEKMLPVGFLNAVGRKLKQSMSRICFMLLPVKRVKVSF